MYNADKIEAISKKAGEIESAVEEFSILIGDLSKNSDDDYSNDYMERIERARIESLKILFFLKES